MTYRSGGASGAKANEMVFQLMSTNGDGTGTTNAIGDYSAGTDFYITPGSTQRYAIFRMLVFIEDTQALSADEYGNLAALANGVRVVLRDKNDAEIIDLTAGVTIKNNAQWAQVCHDSKQSDYGSGNNFVSVRWTFAKAGSPIFVQEHEKLVVELSDNFTGLVTHTFIVQGLVV